MNKFHCRRRAALWGAAAALLIAAPVSAEASDNDSVTAPVQELVDGLMQIMRAGAGTPFVRRFDMLAPIIDKTFDLEAILQESVGSPWATLSPDQQAMLRQAFRRYTVATYVNNFDAYEGQRFEVSPNTRPVGTEQVVQTRIIPRSGETHELDYVMREGGQGWRAVDVLADGTISRVAVQRSDFRRLLARGGAQALADSLRSKSVDLSEGSS
ncbi:MAG TPA: ABC transporter substrate-binding protein [Rhodopila sp.]